MKRLILSALSIVFAALLLSAHSVDLTWTQSTGNVAYNSVYRSVAGGAFSKVYTSSTPITSWTDPAVPVGYYTYAVTATDTNGQESGYSDVARALVADNRYAGHKIGGGRKIGSQNSTPPLLTYAQPPQAWVHNPIGSTASPDTQPNPICPGPHLPVRDAAYTSPNGYEITLADTSITGFQAAINDWTNRSGGNYRILIPAGTVLAGSTYTTFAGNSPLNVPYNQHSLIQLSPTAGVISNPTGCLVIEAKAHDAVAVPSNYTMLCSHGLPGQGGTRNPGCTNDVAKLWTIRMDETSGAHTGYSALYVPPGAKNIVIRDVEATILPGSAQSMSNSTGSAHSPIWVAPESSNIFLEYAYVHGWDPGDAATARGWDGQPAGVSPNWTMSGTLSGTGTTTVNWASGETFGMAFGDGTHYAAFFPDGTGFPQGTVRLDYTSTLPACTGGTAYTITSHDAAVSTTTMTLSGAVSGSHTYCMINPPTRWANGSGDDIQNAIKWDADNSSIMWSYIEKIHYWNTEGHSVLTGFSNGPFKLAHNWIEAGSGGLFFGGGPVDTRLGPTKNVEVRANYIAHDLNWKYLTSGAGHTAAPPWGCGTTGIYNGPQSNCQFKWSVKNSFELKFCLNCLIAGNIIEGSWSDGQAGGMFSFAPRVCSAICGIFDQNGLPRIGLQNIRIENNWFRAAPAVGQTGGRSLGPGNGGGISLPTMGVDWINNVFSNLDSNEFGSPNDLSNELQGLGVDGQTYLCQATRASGVAHLSNCVAYTYGPNSNVSISSVIRLGTAGQANGKVRVDYNQRHDPYLGRTVVVCPAYLAPCAGLSGWTGTFTMPYDSTCTDGTCSNAGTDNNGSQELCSNDAAPWNAPTNANDCIDKSGRYGTDVIYTDNVNSNVGAADVLCAASPAAYNNTKTYSMWDVVSASGSDYVSLSNGNVGNAPPNSNWALASSTTFPTCSAANIGTDTFANQSLAYLITDISIGDPVMIFNGTQNAEGNANHPGGMGCSDPSYATWNLAGGAPVTGAGTSLPRAISPTNPVGLDVYYPNSGPEDPSGSASCYIDNGTGTAKNWTFQNNTIVNGDAVAIQGKQLYSQMANNLIFNNVYVTGDNSTGPCAGKQSFLTAGSACEGTASEAGFDAATFRLSGNVIGLNRTLANWCGNPTGRTCPGVNGPVNSFPVAFSDVGFATSQAQQTAGCSAPLAPFNCPQMSLPWANNLKLSDLSISGAYAEKGANISTVSAAQTATAYSCPSGLNCGSTGPFKDAP